MRRLLHRLFPWLHKFEPFELIDPQFPGATGDVRVWYIGFRCTSCKVSGYKVPLGG
jgi:hypothetical protein